MANKILIWNSYKLEPKGGPAGYLYNLSEYLKAEKIDFITFSNCYKTEIVKKTNRFLVLKKLLPVKLKKMIQLKKIINNYYKKTNIDLDLNKYKAIHFHSTWELFKMRKLLVEYRGKVILTSHSPKIYHKELVEDSLNLNYSKLPTKWKKMIEKVDEKAFELTDILIFPCVEAMEPYSNSWNKFDEIVGKKKKVFITTSINMPKTKVEPKTIRKKYKIPENAIIISYVGRHNETKGYDKLLKFGKRMLTKYNNIYFLIAGKEEPLKGLEEKRWIEIGWTNDPHSLINSSDIFILPNKETYFDLILLEVLALNKPVLLSDTGGNKYFKKYNNLDLYYFEKDNVNEMVEKFEEFLKDRNDNKLYYSNSKLIEKDFLMENFVKNYMRFLEGEV